jgi:hypothetical protein
MSNFLNFCTTFLFLLPISLADTKTTYQSCIQVWHQVFLFGKAEEKAFNGNWEQIYWALVCFAYLKKIYWAFKYLRIWTGWMPLSEYWTYPECLWCMWTPMSEWEQPWTPIECAWIPFSGVNTHWVCTYAIETLLNVTHHGMPMRKFSFVSELNTPWTLVSAQECLWVTPWMLVSAHECLWMSIEHPLNACEFAWIPLSEYWTCPEHLWVLVNANEWVGTSPEHPFSAHECLWLSIRKVWMCTSRVLTLTNS